MVRQKGNAVSSITWPEAAIACVVIVCATVVAIVYLLNRYES